MNRTISLVDLSEQVMRIAIGLAGGMPKWSEELTTIAGDLLVAASESGELAVSELAGLREETDGDGRNGQPEAFDLQNPPEVCGLKLLGVRGDATAMTSSTKCTTSWCGHTFRSVKVPTDRRTFSVCPTCSARVELQIADSGDRKAETPEVPVTVIGEALLVWWTAEEDFTGKNFCDQTKPVDIPAYAWSELRSRYGRGGRGRLWVPDHIELSSLPVAEDDPRWTPTLLRSGGVVVETKHAAACAKWGGCITTINLDPVAFDKATEVPVNLRDNAVQDVLIERARQDAKWGEQNHDPFLYLTVLGEEYGESCQAALEARFAGGSINALREEVIQTSAVALAIVECIDRGKWTWPEAKS